MPAQTYTDILIDFTKKKVSEVPAAVQTGIINNTIGSSTPRLVGPPAPESVAAPEYNTPAPTPPAPEPVSPPFAFQQPKVVTAQETQTQSKTEQNVYPPAYDAANQGLQKLGDDKSKNLQQQVDIQNNALELENEAIKEKQRLAELNAVETATLTKKREEEFGKIDADIKAKSDALSKFEFKDFYADKSTFAKIMMAVAIGVNEYAAVGPGGNGKNTSLEIIQNAIALDFNKQKATLDKMKMDYDVSKGQRGMTQENYERKVSDLNLAHAQALDKAADLIKQKALDKVKKPEIKQQFEANMIALKEQSLNMQKAEAEKQKQNVVKQTTVQEKASVVGGFGGMKPKDVQDYEKGSDPIKALRASTDTLKDLRAMTPEVSGLALLKYYATPGGMGQGSTNSEMMKEGQKLGVINAAGEWVRSKLEGGVDPEFMKKIIKAQESIVAGHLKAAKADLDTVNEMRKQNNLPPLKIDPSVAEAKPRVSVRKPK